MEIKLQRETLLRPLQQVIGVVERHQTLPILSNVLVSAKKNTLSITGTDLEVELIGKSPLEASAKTLSHLTLPGRKLMDICKALPEGAPIELYTEKQQVILRSGRSRFTLSTLPAADFPNVETQDAQLSFSISQNKLLKLLQRTHFSMAHQDVRYYLNGMLLEVHANTLRTIATDGHRLAVNAFQSEIKCDHRLQIIVPRKGVNELMRLLDNKDDAVNIEVGTNHIQVISDSYRFTSKLLEGRFPDYKRVIPKSGDKEIIIDRDILKQALQRASILSNEKFRGIRLQLSENTLKLSANNPEQEFAEEELSIDYNKEELDIGFNVNYFLEILNTLKPGNVMLTFTDSNSSILIEEEKATSESFFVVMPMRL